MSIKNLFVFVIASIFNVQVFAEGSSNKYHDLPAVDCVVNPYRVADIASPVAGVIESLYVERSQQVKAGQVVAQLDADVERASVELAKYRADIQSEIELGQVNMRYDQRRSKRIKSLRSKQAVSMEDIDEAEREAGVSKWKLHQAREFANVRQLELKRAQEQLRQKSIKAPFDGFVLDTFKHRGEYVEDQSIFRLAQLNPLVIEAIVPMENFGEIKVGMEAEILPEAKSQEKLVGKVSIVDRIGDTASNTFGVRLVMPNPENRIPAGIKCVVKFFQQNDENIAENSKHTPDVMVERIMVDVMLGNSEYESGINVTDVIEIQPEDNALFVQNIVAENHVEIDPEISAQILASDQTTSAVYLNEQDEIVQNGLSYQQAENIDIEERQKSRFLVVTEQAETRPLTRELISQLRDSGVNDLQEMDSGPHKGYISLGLYDRRKFAEKRQQALASLGFYSSIRDRY